MNDIKFSIMTPVYGVEEYLDECVQSVLNQSYDNFELILVDDGSPDRCGEMCDAWAEKDSRIRVYHKPNGGLVHTRSYALERASGDYYVFLDSDDYIQANTLETLYTKIKETGCDCVIYGCSNFSGGTVLRNYSCSDDIAGKLFTDKREVYNIIFCTGSYNSLCRKCAKASCFDGRDYSPYYGVTGGEDLLRSTEILEHAESFLFIPDILYAYRLNDDSMCHTVCYDDYEPDNLVAEAVDSFLVREGIFLREDYDRLRNARLDRLAVELRRISRSCSDDEKAMLAMERVRRDIYTDKIVSAGYRNVSPCAGVPDPGLLRSILFRVNIALFRKGDYKGFIRLDRLTSKLGGR